MQPKVMLILLTVDAVEVVSLWKFNSEILIDITSPLKAVSSATST